EQWCVQRAIQWGVTSAIYQNRVEGEFASSDQDAVIPLLWIELAQQRLIERKIEDPGLKNLEPMDQIGVDVGRGGAKSVIAPRHGSVIPRLTRNNVADTTVVTGMVSAILDRNPGCMAMIDLIGIG